MGVSFVIRMHKSRTTQSKDGKYPIVLQTTWNRKVRHKRIGLSCLEDQWNFEEHEFKKGVHGRSEKNRQLEEILEKAEKLFKANFLNVRFNYEQFNEFMRNKETENICVAEFCKKVGNEFIALGKASSGKYYKSTGIAVLKVSPHDLSFADFDEMWLSKFEKYHTDKKVKSHNYMVHLRSIYNKAVKSRLVDFRNNPFKNPYTNPYGYDFTHLKKLKFEKKSKRIKDLSKEQLTLLKGYKELSDKEKKYMAIWWFSFYCFGVNLIDLANLKYKDIRNDRWYYNRSKTDVGLRKGKPLIPEALSIINEFGLEGDKNSYVFDILVGFDENQEIKTQRVLDYANYVRNACKRVAKRLDFDGHFTYYSARHSAATLALNEGADRNTISHLLDHENLSTIDNYAGRADDNKVIEAMEILRL